ncbi:hypothetical protein RhiJN_22474 [Ceratobasidium sp. AG-Ba]|nr:hypothetical protein RhiJN_22474 [Ceratobasidium sp. AG-Ba]
MTGRRRQTARRSNEQRRQSSAEEEQEENHETLSREQILEAYSQLQLEVIALKQECVELKRERDTLLVARSRKRRRIPQQDEPTADDVKYQLAGKRCALLYMLWVTPDLYDVEWDDSYTEDKRYSETEPGMAAQGELRDILASLDVDLMKGLVEEAHYQKIFGYYLGEQRRTTASRVRQNASAIFDILQDEVKSDSKRGVNAEFKRMLGFREGGATPSKRWPRLAPVLSLDGDVKDPKKFFRSPYIKKTFRAFMFGPSSINTTSEGYKAGGNDVLARVLRVRTITVGAIAAAAILTRWAISPDAQFQPVGATTGIQWFSDFRGYKKLIGEALEYERKVFEDSGESGPYSSLVDEWNTEFFPFTRGDEPGMRQDPEDSGEPDDIAEALAAARAWAENR